MFIQNQRVRKGNFRDICTSSGIIGGLPLEFDTRELGGIGPTSGP